MDKIRREENARVRRNQCLSLGLTIHKRGLGSDFRSALDNAASVFPWRDSDPAGKSHHPLFWGLEESRAAPCPLNGGWAAWSELAGRGKVEIARILVFHSATLLPTGGFIPLCNAAVTMWAFNESCRGLAMVLTREIALWSLLGAICCLIWNVGIQPMWRISRGKMGKPPYKSPWGHVISCFVMVTRVTAWSPRKDQESTPDLHSPTFEGSSFIRTSSAITSEEKDYEGKGRDWRFGKELTGHFEEYQV